MGRTVLLRPASRARSMRAGSCGVQALALVADDVPVIEMDDALTERVDDLGVVRRDHERRAEIVHPKEELDDLPARDRVEVVGGLVRDEDARAIHERASDRRSLLLAARELIRAEIARLDAQVDVAEGLGAVGVVLAYRVKRDQLRRPSLARFRPNHNRVLAQNTTSVRSK